MPIPEKYQVDFCESRIYHVFNRTNNNEKLFVNDDNRYFFLRKYDEYLSPYLETYAWCLLPNHFHLVVKIKITSEIELYQNVASTHLSINEKKYQQGQISISELIEHSFQRFFQSYALAFNKAHKRKGNLFNKPFRRCEIDRDSYFTQAIIYVHANPVKHRLVNNLSDWKWSSWKSYLTQSPTKLKKNEVLDWFGGKDQFVKLHLEMTEYYDDNTISLE